MFLITIDMTSIVAALNKRKAQIKLEIISEKNKPTKSFISPKALGTPCGDGFHRFHFSIPYEFSKVLVSRGDYLQFTIGKEDKRDSKFKPISTVKSESTIAELVESDQPTIKLSNSQFHLDFSISAQAVKGSDPNAIHLRRPGPISPILPTNSVVYMNYPTTTVLGVPVPTVMYTRPVQVHAHPVQVSPLQQAHTQEYQQLQAQQKQQMKDLQRKHEAAGAELTYEQKLKEVQDLQAVLLAQRQQMQQQHLLQAQQQQQQHQTHVHQQELASTHTQHAQSSSPNTQQYPYVAPSPAPHPQPSPIPMQMQQEPYETRHLPPVPNVNHPHHHTPPLPQYPKRFGSYSEVDCDDESQTLLSLHESDHY